MGTNVPPHARDLIGKAERHEALDEPLPVFVGREDRRRPAPREQREDLGARGAEAGPRPPRRASWPRARGRAVAMATRPRAPPCTPPGSPCPRARAGRRRTAAAPTGPRSRRTSGRPGSRRRAAPRGPPSARCPRRRGRARPLAAASFARARSSASSSAASATVRWTPVFSSTTEAKSSSFSRAPSSASRGNGRGASVSASRQKSSSSIPTVKGSDAPNERGITGRP